MRIPHRLRDSRVERTAALVEPPHA